MNGGQITTSKRFEGRGGVGHFVDQTPGLRRRPIHFPISRHQRSSHWPVSLRPFFRDRFTTAGGLTRARLESAAMVPTHCRVRSSHTVVLRGTTLLDRKTGAAKQNNSYPGFNRCYRFSRRRPSNETTD